MHIAGGPGALGSHRCGPASSQCGRWLRDPCPLQVLCSWLSNSPNYEEITKWYLGWKSMFSDQVLAHPSVKDKFNEALDIMNRAVSSNVGEWGSCGVSCT